MSQCQDSNCHLSDESDVRVVGERWWGECKSKLEGFLHDLTSPKWQRDLARFFRAHGDEFNLERSLYVVVVACPTPQHFHENVLDESHSLIVSLYVWPLRVH